VDVVSFVTAATLGFLMTMPPGVVDSLARVVTAIWRIP
jgi:hypothetical protein